MNKIILLVLVTFSGTSGFSQSDMLVLKKKQKSLQHFWTNSHFTFQTKGGPWITGILTKIGKDSFYLTQEIIRYTMSGADTIHYGGFKFSLKDVYAMPTKKAEIVYRNDQVHVVPGHEKFVWVRNGFLFQLMGAGYVGLNITNHLINGDPPFSQDNLPKLAVGAGVFFIGTLMHFTFDPYIHLGKKYYLQWVPISSQNLKSF